MTKTAEQRNALINVKKTFLALRIIEAQQEHGLSSATTWIEAFNKYQGYRDAMLDAKLIELSDVEDLYKMTVKIEM